MHQAAARLCEACGRIEPGAPARRWCAAPWFAAGLCIVAVIVQLAAIAPARAAPYCLQTVGIPPQCMFGDVGQCRKEALRVNGVCNVNPREVEFPKTPAGRFCLVQNGPILECRYVDRRTCDVESARRSAICVDSARPGTPDVDIFRQ